MVRTQRHRRETFRLTGCVTRNRASAWQDGCAAVFRHATARHHLFYLPLLAMLKEVETLESRGGSCEVDTPTATIEKASPPTEAAHWQLHIGVVVASIFFAIIGALYWTILRDLVWQWWDHPNYSHGFIVPVFSGFIAWQRRKELVAPPQQGSWIGLPVLIVGVIELILGDIGGELFLMRSSLIIIVVGLILFHLGPQILRVLA